MDALIGKLDGSTSNPARNPIQNETVDRPAGETQTSPLEAALAAKDFSFMNIASVFLFYRLVYIWKFFNSFQ